MSEYIGDDDLIYNTSTRIPVCLCIDASGSMSNRDEEAKSRIERVRDGIKQFFQEVLSDDTTQNSAEVAIVTYTETAKVIRDFSTIEDNNNNWEEIVAAKKGDLGIGVLKCLELLDARKQKYKENGVDYFQPWLIIMSDGCPTGENAKSHTTEASHKTIELENNNKLTVVPVFIGDNSDFENNKGVKILQRFSNNRVTPINSTKFSKFFRWLGASVSKVSTDNSFRLDVSELDSWEEI